jgi:hypothetical protein
MKIFDGEREVIYGSSVKFRGGRLTSPLWPTHIVLFLVLLACLMLAFNSMEYSHFTF